MWLEQALRGRSAAGAQKALASTMLKPFRSLAAPAARAALTNTGKLILKDHIEYCLVDAVEHGDPAPIQHLNKAIEQFILSNNAGKPGNEARHKPRLVSLGERPGARPVRSRTPGKSLLVPAFLRSDPQRCCWISRRQ